MQDARRLSPRLERALESLDRWTRASGAPVLVIDPLEDADFQSGTRARGVHITWTKSAIDGLIEFGRTSPRAVIVSPYVGDLRPADLVAAIRRHAPVTVIVAMPDDRAFDPGPLMVAGARSVVMLPYAAEAVWEVLREVEPSLEDHALVSYGPIELDASAYTIRVGGKRIPDPPPREFELLRALLIHAPEIVEDDDIATALWGSRRAGGRDNTVSAHVARLRSRLEGVADVRRIRGRGYSLTLTCDDGSGDTFTSRQQGKHLDRADGMCLMEAVSVAAGLSWSDTPPCTNPTLSLLARLVNDGVMHGAFAWMVRHGAARRAVEACVEDAFIGGDRRAEVRLLEMMRAALEVQGTLPRDSRPTDLPVSPAKHAVD